MVGDTIIPSILKRFGQLWNHFMKNYICVTCGSQFEATEKPPVHCPVCDDQRQYVGLRGQQWTTLDKLKQTHRISFRKKEEGLMAIGMEPSFAIGQRALIIQSKSGNILWDCIPLIDDAAAELINGIGGLKAIAISHPHYYTTMVEWSKAFGDIPIYLHEDDQKWVMRTDKRIQFWEGERKALFDDMSLIRCGGHFDGGTVLHWPEGAGGKGALLTGDIIQVVPDLKHVTFMYSYPNAIPLPAKKVQRIVDSVNSFNYDQIYGAWWDRNIVTNAKQAVKTSAERYIHAIS